LFAGLGVTGLQDDDAKFQAAAVKNHSSLKQLGLSGYPFFTCFEQNIREVTSGERRSLIATQLLCKHPHKGIV